MDFKQGEFRMKKALVLVVMIGMMAVVGCNKKVETPATTTESAITTDNGVTVEAITTEQAVSEGAVTSESAVK